MELPLTIAIVLIAISLAVTVFYLRGSRRTVTCSFSRRRLLADEDLALLRALDLAVGRRYRIMTKAWLRDVIEPHAALGRAERAAWQQRIGGIRLDFLLCDEQTCDVLAAIQLQSDGRCSAGRRQGESFLDDALRSANMHLIRIPQQASYTPSGLARQIDSILSRDFVETLSLTAVRTDTRQTIGQGELTDWDSTSPICDK